MKLTWLSVFLFIAGTWVTVVDGQCSASDNPRAIIECLRYVASGLYGAAVQDLKIVCSIAKDIANCARDEIRDCVAAEVGRAALNEVVTLATDCCPKRENSRCPIRDSVLKDQRCFAADSLVTLATGQSKRIADLRPNDNVLAYDDQTKHITPTQVLTMLDYQPKQFAMFKHITTETGHHLSLTSSHLIPVHPHGYVMAKHVHTGMNVYVMNENGVLINEKVSNVSDVVEQGYVAPLTEHGTLIVNNVAASCYATINSHHVAHTVLAPMRWWYQLFGKERSEVSGVHWFPKMVFEMTNYLVPSIIQK